MSESAKSGRVESVAGVGVRKSCPLASLWVEQLASAEAAQYNSLTPQNVTEKPATGTSFLCQLRGWELNPLPQDYEPRVQPLHFPALLTNLSILALYVMNVN